MNTVLLNIDDSSRRQTIITNIVMDNEARSVRFEFRYLDAAKHWTVSMLDASTDEILCLNVPVVSSYTDLNDLLLPFRYKRIGSIACVPITDSPSSVDPQFENVGEFAIAWGDDFASE